MTLPMLSPAPRRVPWRLRLQVLSDALGLPAFVGFGFTAVSLVLLLVKARSPMPWFVVPLPVIAFVTGVLMLWGCFWSARRTLRILRRGQLAWATLVATQEWESNAPAPGWRLSLSVGSSRGRHGRTPMPTGRWLDYQQQFEQFHDWWKKPLPTPRGSGLARNLALSIFVIVLVGLFCGGALFSGVFLFSALKHDAPSSLKWMATHMMLPFLCVWWLGLLFFARRIWRVRRAFSGGMTPAKLAVRPVMQTRFKMQLPDGQVVTGHAEVNYASRLDSGEAHPSDIAIYDPARPRDALLLSSFLPALSVSPSGRWEQAPEKARDFFTALWAAAEREPKPPAESPEAKAGTRRGTAERGTAAQAEQASHSHRRRPAKAHVRGDDRSTLGRRRKDFWLSPAGKRLERIGWWAIKVYGCVFGLFLGGLLGAYFSSLVFNVLKSFGSGIHVEVVRTRQWGWAVGAVAAVAIGAANVWARWRKKQNGKDALQRVPSSSTKSRARRKALAAEECEQDSSGSFLHRILFTFVGALLGMAVAAKLVLVWFSIAVSPFAPQGWAHSIYGVMNTKHPLAFLLFLGPIVLFALVGGILDLVSLIQEKKVSWNQETHEERSRGEAGSPH